MANTAAGVFFGATMIQGLLVLNYPSYDYQRWHGTLLLYAALVVVFLVNTVGAKLLPKIEGFILIIHTLGFFAILIPLVYLAPHGSPSFVFGSFINAAGWNNNGLAWFVGLISTNLPFIGMSSRAQQHTGRSLTMLTGYDGPCHMGKYSVNHNSRVSECNTDKSIAEEVQNASTIVPWCMICTILLNGILGFAVVLAFCFCVGDLEIALTSPTGYDFIEVFYNATDSSAATSVMTSVLITLVICASFGFLASSSRQTWAFARDRGLPFSDYLAHVRIELSETQSLESMRSKELVTGQQARGYSSPLNHILCHCHRAYRPHQRRFHCRLQRYCVAHNRWSVHIIYDPDNTSDHQEVQG